MTIHLPARIAALSCSLALLAGCASFLTADRDLDIASRQIGKGNITLTADDTSVPKAAITPRGDFLVAGKSIELSTQQRGEVLAYRSQYIDIAQKGIAIGHEGVEVGRHAVAPMIFAALFGASDETIDARMHKRLAGVRAETLELCGQLPTLLKAQQRLASDLPAFEPYATLTQEKVDDCRKDAADSFDTASTDDDR